MTRFLYISCWGTGDMHQYDVSDPFHPKLTGTVRLGGIVSRKRRIRRSGRRSTAAADARVEPRRQARLRQQFACMARGTSNFIPRECSGWVAKLDANPAGGLEARSEVLPDLRRRAAASDSPRRRRRLLRFVLLSVSGAWPWLAVAMLGAYHGIDPSMGWLFAVALGSAGATAGSSGSYGRCSRSRIGHLVSIAAVVALVGGLQIASPQPRLRPLGGAGHPDRCSEFFASSGRARIRAGWRCGSTRRELALWSFLMASAHGAGLMLFPILMNGMPMGRRDAPPSRDAAHAHHHVADRRAGHPRSYLRDAAGDGHDRDRSLRIGRPRDFAQRVDQSRHDLGWRPDRSRPPVAVHLSSASSWS